MRSNRLRQVAACLLAGLAVASPAAHAAASEIVANDVKHGDVAVRYVNNKYVPVAHGASGNAYAMEVDTHLVISTAVAASGVDGSQGIKSWSAWVKVHGQDAYGETSFDAYKTSKSYPFAADPFHIGQYGYIGYPKQLQQDRQIVVPGPAMLKMAADRCNLLLGSLTSQGMTKEQFLAQDHTMQLAVQPVLRYVLGPINNTVTDTQPQSWGAYKKLTVTCKGVDNSVPQARGTTGTTPGASKPGVGPALITQVNLALQYPTAPVQCPVQVTASMTFRASSVNAAGEPIAPGHFSYRARSASGKASKNEMMTFQESERQGANFVKVVQQAFMVPAAQVGGGGAGGQVGMQAVGGLAAPTLPAGGGHAGPAGGAAGAFASGNIPNVHQDSLWVDITGGKQGSVSESEHVAYRVTCQITPAHRPGGLGAVPDPQLPGNPGFAQPAATGGSAGPGGPTAPAPSSTPGSKPPAPPTSPPPSSMPVPPSSPKPGANPSPPPSSIPPTPPSAQPGPAKPAPAAPSAGGRAP